MRRHGRRVGIGVLALMMVVGMATEAGAAPGIVWERVEGIYGGNVERLAATAAGALLAGTSRGVYRSEDGGESWLPSGLPNISVKAMAVEGNTVYVGGAEGPRRSSHRSDDGGRTWEVTGLKLWPRGLAIGGGAVYVVYPVGNVRLGVFRSIDGGVTWSEARLDEGGATGVVVSDAGVFAASSVTVFHSVDGEGGWVDIGADLPGDELVDLARVGQTVYVATETEGVYRLDLVAETWERTSLDGVDVDWLRAAGGTLFAGTQGREFSRQPGLARSDDGGNNWSHVEIGHGVYVHDALRIGPSTYVASHAGVFVSDDDGASYRNVSRGLPSGGVFGIASAGQRIYVSGGRGVHVSDDGGSAWRQTGLYWGTPVIATDERTTYAATWDHGLFRSDDAGYTWREVNNGVPTQDSGRGIYYPSNPREILLTPSYVYVDYYHGAFLRSGDGESWDPLGGPVLFNERPAFQVGDGPLTIGEHAGALYAVAHGLTTRSFDGGDTWEELRGAGFVRGADLHTFGGQLYIAAEVGVYRWSDQDSEWIDTSEGLPLVRENRSDDDRSFHGTRFATLGKSLYVGNQVHRGVHRLYAGTDKWVSAGLDGLLVWDLLAYQGGLLAATDEGLYRGSVDQNVAVEPRGKSATAWADIKLAALVPEQSALLPNYPNPFNPETWIPFDLAEPSSVSVRIYDARGRVVRALDLGSLSPGRYRARDRAARWDGRDATGSPVASGVYVVEFVAGSYSARRRIVVRK